VEKLAKLGDFCFHESCQDYEKLNAGNIQRFGRNRAECSDFVPRRTDRKGLCGRIEVHTFTMVTLWIKLATKAKKVTRVEGDYLKVSLPKNNG
jgi:hypothetical protein